MKKTLNVTLAIVVDTELEKVGDIVEVHVPAGIMKLRIDSIQL